MPLDDALRQGGFRRWYQRQLIESHVWLVTAVLALIMMAIALETLDLRSSLLNVVALVAIAAAGGATVFVAWRRFSWQLARAEALASQAVCSSCDAYGRFEVLQGRNAQDAISGRMLRVRCRRCAHEWQMG